MIILNGENLSFDKVLKVAFGAPGEPRVLLSEEAKRKVHRCAKAVDELLRKGEIAYGITTGFGALKDKIIPKDEAETLQKNIILSHSVGVGKPFDRQTTRAIMLIRANTLARGFSGIRLETLELVLELLNRGVHPVIPEKGSLGASGDLAPLAHFAATLIGEGKAEISGEILDSKEALKIAGLEPINLKAKEGLALTNGTSVMTAIGVLETHRARRLANLADIAGCLSLEALNGTLSAFDERIHKLRPHPRQLECANRLRQILEGSEFVRGFDPSNIQDAYTLRCIPQVHGACRDAVAYAEWLLEIELNSVTDNPLIFINNDESIEVISGGNFHGEPLALAFDYLAIALAELCNISERRIMRLTDEASNSHVLPAFLTQQSGLNSGFMIVQYTAAALCSENKILAHPASVDTIPTSANVEDHVSMGLTSALKLRQINENLEYVLSLELLAAAQGIDFRRRAIGENKRLGKITSLAYEKIRSVAPFIEKDTFMKPIIDSVVALVRNRELDLI
ncbi:MAG: histidine ammonia-lyase [Pyrinomonadaceae bacterium]|nr:histidine ammonia-lyase [Pyrinomonadaceae bacterium]